MCPHVRILTLQKWLHNGVIFLDLFPENVTTKKYFNVALYGQQNCLLITKNVTIPQRLFRGLFEAKYDVVFFAMK
jgi:hypothetical protein